MTSDFKGTINSIIELGIASVNENRRHINAIGAFSNKITFDSKESMEQYLRSTALVDENFMYMGIADNISKESGEHINHNFVKDLIKPTDTKMLKAISDYNYIRGFKWIFKEDRIQIPYILDGESFDWFFHMDRSELLEQCKKYKEKLLNTSDNDMAEEI